MTGTLLVVLALSGEPPTGPDVDETVVTDVGESAGATVDDGPEQPPPDPDRDSDPAPPAGGFGSVESVSTDANVHAPPPPSEDDDDESEDESDPRQRWELSGIVEVGYAQTSLGNADGLDHHGLSFRAHFVFYPWVSKRRRIAGGIGLAYAYQGLNRWKLPAGTELEKRSSAQQQQVLLSVDMLVRPHPQWFSIQPAALIGLGFYTNAELLAADRPASIANDEYAFAAAGSLALCTAWDIVCLVGGTRILLDVWTDPLDPEQFAPVVIDPLSWNIGVGLDVLRILARSGTVPS